LAAALAIFALGAGPVAAWEVYQGEKLRATLDSTFSTGIALRVAERDNDLIYKGNDPTDPTAGNTASFFTNADDGNLNYDKGDLYSGNVKGTFELELDYRAGWQHLSSVGGFVRASGFYDAIANDPYRTQRTDLAKSARYRSSVTDGGVVGAQWIFLDMYADARFDVLNRNPILRVGNQVLNWGEAIFTPGGISSTNAFDVAKLRIPGSELREALVPAPIIRVSGDIVEELGLEAYYQVYWNRTHVDPTGSYWATSDLVGRAAEGLFFGNDPGGTGVPADELIQRGRGIPRIADDKPSNQGQFGIATRYYWDRILTEFGAYYIRYHSKTPTVGNQPALPLLPSAYFREYADKIDVVGASFATGILNATLAGEIVYRWDDQTPIVATGNAFAAASRASQEGTPLPARIRGYVREQRLQAAINLIQTFGPSTRLGVGPVVKFLGADSFSLVSEMALVNYPSLAPQCSSPFQPFFDVAAGTRTDCVPYAGVGPPDNDVTVAGFPVKSDVNATSLGYQLLLRGEYTKPFSIPITVNPTVGWRHDFRGTAPNQTFIENRKSASLGLAVDYLQTWEASITYANFFGGGTKNLVHDRDFVSISLAYRY